ncbi:hypothetical protein K7I13_11005 [Brucepastera parasyntrophica]|uniref:hypothetical protein n=1 Tax=Brucepastera parasyntrophica TaxID=2880008 RepID=UPI00210D38A5|nr:hypothetical protein [Brucepastera parasyntrophica]ULQ59036.1 hypothetical protein K7I13_11005 [Brucepastera parasyntrophica]
MIDNADVADQIVSGSEIYITPEQLSLYFVRPVKREPSPVLAQTEPEVKPAPAPVIIRNPDFLVYLGSAGTSNGETLFLLKDTRKNSVMKLRTKEEDKNYIIENAFSELEVMYDGKIYGVKK